MKTETITWHAATQPPDADTTVLLWVREDDDSEDWAAGWWDGEDWRDAASGGVVAGVVMHWADVAGPEGLNVEVTGLRREDTR